MLPFTINPNIKIKTTLKSKSKKTQKKSQRLFLEKEIKENPVTNPAPQNNSTNLDNEQVFINNAGKIVLCFDDIRAQINQLESYYKDYFTHLGLKDTSIDKIRDNIEAAKTLVKSGLEDLKESKRHKSHWYS
jgi:hypothetical protein